MKHDREKQGLPLDDPSHGTSIYLTPSRIVHYQIFHTCSMELDFNTLTHDNSYILADYKICI